MRGLWLQRTKGGKNDTSGEEKGPEKNEMTPAEKDPSANSMRKILVTGASGFLGGRLCLALLREGHAVRALARPTSDLSYLLNEDGGNGTLLEIAYGDVTDLGSLSAAVSGCNVVFHAAALVEPWLPDPSRFFKVNVDGLSNVLQACRESGTVQKIIYTSSFFALGPTDGYVADESQMHEGKFFCSEYEKSKAIADKIALDAATSGLPIVVLYPGVIYGCGKLTSGNICAHLMIERFNWRLPGYIGYGADKFSFSHVDDVVDGHLAAMLKGRVGERYLLTGEVASFTHIFDLAASLTQTRKPCIHIPLCIVEVYGWISVFIARITKKLPLVSYPVIKVLKHQWAFSFEKAKRELDYNPRSLKEGLAEVLIWLRNIGQINY